MCMQVGNIVYICICVVKYMYSTCKIHRGTPVHAHVYIVELHGKVEAEGREEDGGRDGGVRERDGL